ncbi:MAG: class I SAM-dependent methyltransferase [Emergencia sp.]
MKYTYPDREDALTCELIMTEYDDAYWGVSEERILAHALKAAEETAAAMREAHPGCRIPMLDLGCGKGRLFETFAPAADEITGVEPDPDRWSAACDAAKEVSEQTGTPITVLNGDASVLPENAVYPILLSSHVMQHIRKDMSRELMASIAQRLVPGGLLIMTTTHTAESSDLFFSEFWENGRRQCTPVSEEEFDALYGRDGILPVRIFAEQTIIDMAASEGLELLSLMPYHYKNHHDPEEDAAASAAGESGEARDVLFLFRKEAKTTIDGNISYYYSFSIFNEETGLRTDDEGELRSAIRSAYPDAVFDDDENALSEPLFRDLSTGQQFLHGGGLPFHCFRTIIKKFDLQFPPYEVTQSTVFMTVFPESDTVQVCICLSVRNAGVDDFVYLHQVQANGAKLRNADGALYSVREIFSEVSACLQRKVTDVEPTYMLEIKRYGSLQTVGEILERKRELYGIMAGDEGWRHVPEDLAESRLENCWGSRRFMRFIAFGTNSIFLNLSRSADAGEYREYRRLYDRTYYGDMNPYFLMDSETAGINHGIQFSMEMVMVIKTICNRILRRQASYYSGGQGTGVQADIRKLKAYRGELITTLNKVENLEISELGELEHVMLKSQQIAPIIEKIKYLLELLESELDLLYQTSTNRLINFLTVAGLVLAAIQVMQGIF